MTPLIFGICCFLAITAMVMAVIGFSYNKKCSDCINNPSIYCYNDWRCANGTLIKTVYDDLMTRCSRTESTSCPCTASWTDPVANTGPNGNYGATGSYNPALSTGVTGTSLCGLWSD